MTGRSPLTKGNVTALPKTPAAPESTAPPSTSTGLRVRNVTVRFGGVEALRDVSFDVFEGEITAIIGPNGAGKTTLFNCVSRLQRPTAGSICWHEKDLLGAASHEIVSIGIARTFQNVALCASLTVHENVMLGGYALGRVGFVRGALRLGVRSEEAATRAAADEALDIVGLSQLRDAHVTGLPYGTQKRVELARALASAPQLLLLDEPAGGLPHGEVEQLGELIMRLREQRNLTVVVVEHHMGLVTAISERIVAMGSGHLICTGPPAEVLQNPDVVAAYLTPAA